MISEPLRGEIMEHIYHSVLEQLAGAEDDDTIRAQLVLEDWIEQIRAFRQPRASVIEALEHAIADEITVGELRRRVRNSIGQLARGDA